MELSDRLRGVRKEAGVSQLEFAKSLGLQQGSYSGLETGAKKTLSGAVRELLQLQFGINPTWLETGEGVKYINGYAPKKATDSLVKETEVLYQKEVEKVDPWAIIKSQQDTINKLTEMLYNKE